VHVKFNKYLKNNARDLGDCKIQALRDFNYDQLENFLEYEQYLGQSYYSTLVIEFISFLK
jgi:hypothetical protein